MVGPGARVVASCIGFAFLLLTGCSSNAEQDEPIGVVPATAAQSPAIATTPAGVVHPVGQAIDSITFDPVTRTAVVVVGDGKQVLLFAGGDLAAAPRVVETPEPVAQVSLALEGVALLAMKDRVGLLDVAGGEVTSLPVDGDVRSAAQLADGRIAAGLSNGEIHIIDASTNQSQEDDPQVISGLDSADGIAVVGGTVTALDRSQTSVTEINVATSSQGAALRAGEGATQFTTDPYGRILITDTNGDELLVYTTDTLMLRQRFPVGAAPYAVAYDTESDRVWVTLTETNEVVGFDLSSGVGVETGRFPTVRQPDSVAVDTVTGDLLIGSATGDGLQQIPTRSP